MKDISGTSRADAEKLPEGYEIITVMGHRHIVANYDQPRGKHAMPNYMGTGKALVGVLRQGETFYSWNTRRKRYAQILATTVMQPVEDHDEWISRCRAIYDKQFKKLADIPFVP